MCEGSWKDESGEEGDDYSSEETERKLIIRVKMPIPATMMLKHTDLFDYEMDT